MEPLSLDGVFAGATVKQLENHDIPRIKKKDGGYVYPEEVSMTATGSTVESSWASLKEKIVNTFEALKTESPDMEYAVSHRPGKAIQKDDGTYLASVIVSLTAI